MFANMSEVEKITCQGIFAWTGQEYKRLKKIRFLKFTRDRKIFYALNVPGVSKLTDKQLAQKMIIDLILDEGIESPFIIHDPQKIIWGFMSPATDEEVTNNPGRVVWLGWMEIPRSARFSEPGMHNVTVKAAFASQNITERVFDEAHGSVIQKYEFEIIDDYPDDDRPTDPVI